MALKKHIVTTLIVGLAAFIFTAEPGLADSSSRQYLQYKNSDTYKMIHGEENKDTDSVQKGSYRPSPSEDNPTNDNDPKKTESLQPGKDAANTESQAQDDSLQSLSPQNH